MSIPDSRLTLAAPASKRKRTQRTAKGATPGSPSGASETGPDPLCRPDAPAPSAADPDPGQRPASGTSRVVSQRAGRAHKRRRHIPETPSSSALLEPSLDSCLSAHPEPVSLETRPSVSKADFFSLSAASGAASAATAVADASSKAPSMSALQPVPTDVLPQAVEPPAPLDHGSEGLSLVSLSPVRPSRTVPIASEPRRLTQTSILAYSTHPETVRARRPLESTLPMRKRRCRTASVSASADSTQDGDKGPAMSKCQALIMDLQNAPYISNEEIRDRYPYYYFLHNSKIQTMRQELQEEIRVLGRMQTVWVPPEPTDRWGKGWKEVMCWMKHVVRRPENYCKKMHLWLWGPSGMGKTMSFVEPLRNRLLVYEIQKDSTFNNPWLHEHYELAVCDEYGGEKPVTWWNEFTGGAEMQLRVPGGGVSVKRKTVPVIIVCNKRIKELYSAASDDPKDQKMLEAFQARFWEIEVSRHGDPFGVGDALQRNEERMQRAMEREAEPRQPS